MRRLPTTIPMKQHRCGGLLKPLSAVLIVLATAAPPRTAGAFEPISCPVCPTYTTFTDFNWTTDNWVKDGTGANYINHQQFYGSLTANPYVIEAYFRVAKFSTEPAYDGLAWNVSNTDNLSQAANPAMTGTPYTPGTWFGYSSIAGLENAPIRWQFYADGTVNSTGIAFDYVKVCCSQNPGTRYNAASLLTNGERQSGILLGTGDVVYFTLPGSTPELTNKTYSLALRGNTPSNDYDLYVRCGAYPTEFNSQLIGNSWDTQEFLNFGSMSCASTWYVAVRSFRGGGTFNIVANERYKSQDVELHVGLTYSASAAELSTLQNRLRQGVGKWYGANEGRIYVQTVHLYNATGPDCGLPNLNSCGGNRCNVCIYNTQHNEQYDWGLAAVHLMNTSDTNTIAHELGHMLTDVPRHSGTFLGLGDERIDNVGACGHSIMTGYGGGPIDNANNLCFDNSGPFTSTRYMKGYGNAAGDHKTDSAHNPPTSEPACWTRMYDRGIVPSKLALTPDNYDYADFDFNGVFGPIIH